VIARLLPFVADGRDLKEMDADIGEPTPSKEPFVKVQEPEQPLHPDAVQKLKDEKIRLRIGNEKYMRQHPEINKILAYFMRNLLLKKPDDTQAFAVGIISLRESCFRITS
jgi:hypothetical protein